MSETTIGIMQPYFLPYIGYWQLINAVDKYVIYDDANYIKRGWINRNYILLNKQKHLFTLCLCKASQNKKINEITVLADQAKLVRTFEAAYKKAPFFDVVAEMVFALLEYNDKNLAKLVGNSIIQIAEYLNMETEFVYSSELDKRREPPLKGQGRIIHICEALRATKYYNSMGGRDLYDKEKFGSHNIKLNFLKAQPVEYKQFNNPFVPGLSILDTLMFNSVDEVKKYLNMYNLE
ncbi:MAG: WbqC family protein [Lachnospiraceae bacterium]|jgi:hypothetical protein|nr:WbqC family protein [Lachnospiraceae bacterium]